MNVAKHETINIAVVQMRSVDSYSQNLKVIQEAIEQCVSMSARVIFFPENCAYLRMIEGQDIPGIQIDGPEILALQKSVERLNVIVHLGSVALSEANVQENFVNSERQVQESSGLRSRLTNASILLAPGTSPRVMYRKLHLFDVDVAGAGRVRESDVFDPGTALSIIEIDGWRFASSICYDLRFSELYACYAKHEVDAILIPSSFLVPTGVAHWHVLIRARAIESQAFVIAAAQGGVHRSIQDPTRHRSTYGHSLVVDPWGVIQQESSGGESESQNGVEILIHELDRATLKKVRSQIPMHGHRKGDVGVFRLDHFHVD